MTVGTPQQPNFETQTDGTDYKVSIDNAVAVLSRYGFMFAPYEQATPDMSIRIYSGFIGSVEIAAQNSPTFSAAHATLDRIDLVVADLTTGAASVVEGTPHASPTVGAVPANKFPIAEVLITANLTAVLNANITDRRYMLSIISAAGQLPDGILTADHFGAGVVEAAAIAANAITGSKMLSGTITADKIANLAITAALLASGSVTVDKLADNSVTFDKMAHGTEGKLMGYGSGGVPQAVDAPSSAPEYLIIEDQKSSGTHGGTFNSGAWRDRDLNTIVVNQITGASLASNEITLPAGDYEIASAHASAFVNAHQAKLYNVTDASDEVLGMNHSSSAASGSPQATGTNATVEGYFTITAEKDFKIQHRSMSSRGTTGFGLAGNWGTEVYSRVVIKKVG